MIRSCKVLVRWMQSMSVATAVQICMSNSAAFSSQSTSTLQNLAILALNQVETASQLVGSLFNGLARV